MFPALDPRWADLPLVFGLLTLALWIISTRRDRSAVIGFTAFGLLVSLAWVRLGSAKERMIRGPPSACGCGLRCCAWALSRHWRRRC